MSSVPGASNMPRLSVAPLLGAVGIVTAGPLVATLLMGRTGIAPGLRWLGLALATWLTFAALAWAVAAGRPVRAARALAPLAALSAFLPWAYLDDRAFHALSRGAPLALACLGALVLLGLAWQARPVRLSIDVVGERATKGSQFSPPMVTSIAGLGLMFGLNDVLFEPLGRQGSGPIAPLIAIAGVVPALVLTLSVRGRLLDPFGVAALTATACVSAALAVWLGLAPPGPALFAIAAAGLVPAAHDAFWRAFPGWTKSVAIVVLGLGVALAATHLQAYGLAVRELIAVTPSLANALPALGLLPCAAVFAYGAALGSSPSHLAQRGDGRDA